MTGETPAVHEALAVYAPETSETKRVPSGYKRTEVGMIPEDWEVALLSDLVTSGPKNGYSGRSGKDTRGTLTLSLAATSSGHLILEEETVKQLYETIDPWSDLFLKSGDVLVQRSNTLNLVGTTVVFDGPSGVYAYPDLMMRLRFKENATAQWFWRYANSGEGRRYFVSIAAGSTGGRRVLGSSYSQLFADVLSQVVVYLVVPGNGALLAGRFVSELRVTRAFTVPLAAGRLEVFDELVPLHRARSSLSSDISSSRNSCNSCTE